VEAPKDTMMANLLTINDKLPYTELKKIIEVEGEKNQTAEEINVGVFFSRQRAPSPLKGLLRG